MEWKRSMCQFSGAEIDNLEIVSNLNIKREHLRQETFYIKYQWKFTMRLIDTIYSI